MTVECDVAIVGGGPAGSAAARVLATKHHRVVVLTTSADPVHSRAESLPPSTRRVLARTGVLPAIDKADFYRTTGNSVWWGEREADVERFGLPEHAAGYQVDRARFDGLLRREAAGAGASVLEGVQVRGVETPDAGVQLTCEDEHGSNVDVRASLVLDASGRAGVIATRGWRRHQSGFSSQAYLGAWTSPRGWNLPDPTHTIVETYDDGWAYSVPLSATVRHIGVVVDGGRSRIRAEPNLVTKYLGEIGKTRVIAALAAEGTLERAWASAASMYDATCYAGDRWLLIGDAGSFLEPLSSFGVKKALTSGWMGAVCAHSSLAHADRRGDSFAFFTRWERRVYDSSLRYSCEYAREAHARHPHPFWTSRAAVDAPPDLGVDERALLRQPDVLTAFEQLKQTERVRFSRGRGPDSSAAIFIRDDEIVVEEGVKISGLDEPIRFFADVDLVALRDMACAAGTVSEVLEFYQRRIGEAPVPALLGSLSLLVSRGILVLRQDST